MIIETLYTCQHGCGLPAAVRSLLKLFGAASAAAVLIGCQLGAGPYHLSRDQARLVTRLDQEQALMLVDAGLKSVAQARRRVYYHLSAYRTDTDVQWYTTGRSESEPSMVDTTLRFKGDPDAEGSGDAEIPKNDPDMSPLWLSDSEFAIDLRTLSAVVIWHCISRSAGDGISVELQRSRYEEYSIPIDTRSTFNSSASVTVDVLPGQPLAEFIAALKFLSPQARLTFAC